MSSWFTVDAIDHNTYAISEYRHWEETHCYLLTGETSALLIDTGLGVEPIAPIVRSLTSRPVTAVATHIHWDHIGGHGEFESRAVHHLEEGWLAHFPLPLSQVRADLTKDYHDFPPSFRPEEYTPFEGSADRLLRDGDIIDLGGRKITVLHTPGHSPGHMCFWDEAAGHLFSGDLIYRGTLYAFYPSTDPAAFMASAERVARLPIKRLLPGHHALDVAPSLADRALEGFHAIRDKGKLFQGAGLFNFGEVSIQI